MKRGIKKISILLIILIFIMMVFTNYKVKANFTLDDCPYDIEFVQISTGLYHSYGIDSNGNLWTWGYEPTYGMGDEGESTSSNSPIQIKIGTKFKEISAGRNYGMAIDESGNLWAWGYNHYGQLGDGTTTDSKVPIQIKSGTKFVKISAGHDHSMAIDESGNLWTWGYNFSGQLGNDSTESSNIPVQIMSGTKFKEIKTGGSHSMAIDESGNLWTWGYNNKAQLGDGTTTNSKVPIQIKSGTKFVKISAGYVNSMAIDESGNLWTWGDNSYGQLGNGTTESSNIPVQVTSETTFKELEVGTGGTNTDVFCSAIDTNGNLWTWGSSSQGKLGYSTSDNSLIPTKIMEDKTFKKVSSGCNYTIAIDSSGESWSWGFYAYGAKGTGNYAPYDPIRFTGSDYVVTFKNEENIEKEEQVKLLKSATAPELTKAGYTLSWDTDFSSVTSDLTVNAVWTANTNTPYKIEHYKQNSQLDGYVLAETEDKTGTTGAVAIATKKTYEGFTENTEYSERVASGTIAADGSLILKLYYVRDSYNVTLNTNEGTINSGNVATYIYGVGATLPTDVTKTGYTFAGWYDNSEFTGNTITSIGEAETGDKTYYAKWTQNEFTVTFKDGAQVVKTETVNYASAATAPELTKAGYTLSWDKEFNNITSDLTVNAVWTANTNTPYKVEHYLRTTDTEVEGYELKETENLSGTTDSTVTAIVKTYEGFTENTSYTGRVASGTIAGDGSLVLKLYYNRNTYNITYELNGGTATSTLTNSYIYGKGLILSNRVTKQGFAFTGWYDNSELTGNAITSIGITETGDKTYYAKWTQEDEYYITSDKHNIDIQENYITKVSPNTSAQELVNNLNTNGIVKILNSEGEELASSSLVGTGCKVQVDYKGAKYEYEVAVRGDIDGNGKITVTDLSMLNQVLVKKLTVTGIKEKATDIDYSGKITVTDLSMINQAIVGKINL